MVCIPFEHERTRPLINIFDTDNINLRPLDLLLSTAWNVWVAKRQKIIPFEHVFQVFFYDFFSLISNLTQKRGLFRISAKLVLLRNYRLITLFLWNSFTSQLRWINVIIFRKSALHSNELMAKVFFSWNDKCRLILMLSKKNSSQTILLISGHQRFSYYGQSQGKQVQNNKLEFLCEKFWINWFNYKLWMEWNQMKKQSQSQSARQNSNVWCQRVLRILSVHHWVTSDCNLSIFRCITRVFSTQEIHNSCSTEAIVFSFLLLLAYAVHCTSFLCSEDLFACNHINKARMLQQSINIQRELIQFFLFFSLKRIQTSAISYNRWMLFFTREQDKSDEQKTWENKTKEMDEWKMALLNFIEWVQ